MMVGKNSNVVLSLSNVGVSYRQHKGLLQHDTYWALKDISFDLYEGETLGVIGRNGAGKSSLLKLLAGVISQNKGDVTREKDLLVSLLTLQVGFNPHLSGLKNIMLSAIIQGMSPSDVEKCTDDILELADLGSFIHQPVKTYSTGMKARLGFAIAIQMDPDVLLVDEALGVGDAAFREKSKSLMKERILSEKSVVIVSHNIETVRELCDRVLWIESGVVKMLDATEEVLKVY